MKPMPDLFDEFFFEIWGTKPFPWQSEMARRACAGEWPSPVALPTAAGKTAIIDIAVFALACGAPHSARRIFFVVDRRVVVDEAAERAERLAAHLSKSLRSGLTGSVCRRVAEALRAITGEPAAEPLVVATLRGGVPRNDSWARSPLQATICCSTVDQVGSSLLFRAYSARSPYNWPIRAGLVSHDALIVIDEAHCSLPFVETAEAIAERYRKWADITLPGDLRIVQLSATPNRPPQLSESVADLENEILARRWKASKLAKLVVADAGEQTVEALHRALIQQISTNAVTLAESGYRVVGVVVNRVSTARDVFSELNGSVDRDAILLTGRARPWDRERIWRRWRRSIAAGRPTPPERPVFVVATQCIEVGANIDFDGLVTEVASIDALEQRFGRLNRLGSVNESEAFIVARNDQSRDKYLDAVYGSSLALTWQWLNANSKRVGEPITTSVKSGKASTKKKTKERVIDMGVVALRSKLPPSDDLLRLKMPQGHAPVLMPAHLDCLVQTSPALEPGPDVELFLHGRAEAAPDVQLVWRADLSPHDSRFWVETVAMCPPKPMEAVAVPTYAVRRWLGDQPLAEIADLEGVGPESERVEGGRSVLVWRGVDESEIINAAHLRPGMTIVVPASYGGCDEWGWNPSSRQAVVDIGDETNLIARGRAVLRLRPELVRQWVSADTPSSESTEIAEELSRTLDSESAKRPLRRLSKANWVQTWVRTAARLLLRDPDPRLIGDPATTDSDEPRVAALVGSRVWKDAWTGWGEEDFQQESSDSSLTVDVPLANHLGGVRARAVAYARSCCLPEQAASTLALAARLHDIGKADPRFQTWLRSGIPGIGEELLAKSRMSGRDWVAASRALRVSGYPLGGRHELQSVALIAAVEFADEHIDRDLLLHLIASHHGRCRPFAPVVEDTAPVDVIYAEDGAKWSASSRHGLESAGSGISERFWRLTRRYGWFGLAYLEALLRLADHRQSEAEQLEKYGLYRARPASA